MSTPASGRGKKLARGHWLRRTAAMLAMLMQSALPALLPAWIGLEVVEAPLCHAPGSGPIDPLSGPGPVTSHDCCLACQAQSAASPAAPPTLQLPTEGAVSVLLPACSTIVATAAAARLPPIRAPPAVSGGAPV